MFISCKNIGSKKMLRYTFHECQNIFQKIITHFGTEKAENYKQITFMSQIKDKCQYVLSNLLLAKFSILEVVKTKIFSFSLQSK